MVGLVFTIVLIMNQFTGLAGLLRDDDAGHVGYTVGFQNLARSGTACIVRNCTNHFWRSLWRDLRVSPWRYFAVMSRSLWASGTWKEKFFKFLLVKLDDERFDHWSKEFVLACAVIFSSVEKTVPNVVIIFCLVRKFWSKILWMDENYNRFNLITKERRISRLPFYLKLGYLCDGGEWILFSVDQLNKNFLLDRLEDALKEIEITPFEHNKH